MRAKTGAVDITRLDIGTEIAVVRRVRQGTPDDLRLGTMINPSAQRDFVLVRLLDENGQPKAPELVNLNDYIIYVRGFQA